MNKFADNFLDDLYKKVGFKKSAGIVLLSLFLPSLISLFFNYKSNQNLESYKSELDNLKAKDFEMFVYKKNLYVETVKLIDKRFDSQIFHDSKPVSGPPTNEEINNVNRQLLLIADSALILINFKKFLDNSNKDYCSPANRAEFINLLREDLGKKDLNLRADSIAYFRNHEK